MIVIKRIQPHVLYSTRFQYTNGSASHFSFMCICHSFIDFKKCWILHNEGLNWIELTWDQIQFHSKKNSSFCWAIVYLMYQKNGSRFDQRLQRISLNPCHVAYKLFDWVKQTQLNICRNYVCYFWHDKIWKIDIGEILFFIFLHWARTLLTFVHDKYIITIKFDLKWFATISKWSKVNKSARKWNKNEFFLQDYPPFNEICILGKYFFYWLYVCHKQFDWKFMVFYSFVNKCIFSDYRLWWQVAAIESKTVEHTSKSVTPSWI